MSPRSRLFGAHSPTVKARLTVRIRGVFGVEKCTRQFVASIKRVSTTIREMSAPTPTKRRASHESTSPLTTWTGRSNRAALVEQAAYAVESLKQQATGLMRSADEVF